YNLARRRQYQYDARRQQGDGGGVFGDSQFTSTLSVNFHFPKIPRRTFFFAPFSPTLLAYRYSAAITR
ncbi:hypothetical protein, partial [Aeromonas sp. LsrichE-8G]|uniref:hypothetical protein n=1 Tax=Aeromonas sp. LsrichE-8G TaxID=2932048 RepID=UPI001FD3D890